MALFSCYFSPRTTTKKEEATYKRTVRGLIEYLHAELERLPTRAVPLLGLGLNDGLGRIHMKGTGWVPSEHPAH